ncbi:MAG: hypothetical protein NT029_02620 [Armatimonadetes bacterium]|nr:hypothetical protein [Armatimonadota bacterium]
MNLVCTCVRRRLAALAASGADIEPTSWLARHLAACSDCSRERRALASLAGHLSSARLPEPDEQAFAAAVWQKVDALPAPIHRAAWWQSPGLLAAAAGACALALWMAREPAGVGVAAPPHGPVSTARAGGAAGTVASISPASRPKADLLTTPPPAPVPQAKKPATSGSRAPVIPKLRPGLNPATARPRRMLASAGSATAGSTVAWSDWGSYYEQKGDYRSAAYAYGMAHSEKRDPTTAFAYGRASEASGDLASAMDRYAAVLEQDGG